MKIAIDTLFEHPERPSSAMDYLKNLVECLPRAGPEHSYHLFVSPRNRHYFSHRRNGNVHLVNCFVSNENLPLRIFVQQSVLPAQMARHGFDILFSPGNVCPLVGNFCRVLKINTLHHYETPEMIGRARSLYRKLAFARSAKKADRIIANTVSTKDEICRFMGVPEKKVSIVWEALYDVFAPMSPEQTKGVRARYGLSRSYILFVSTLYPYKNPETLIRSFARLVEDRSLDFELVIIGRDYDSHQAKLETLVASLGVSDRTRFLGFIPTEDMPFLYTGARVFVYPSLTETFGKPIVEALRCGVPVVASNTSCIPEVLNDAGILVDPLDVEQMSEAIYQALSNEQLRSDLIARGQKRAGNFSWKTGAKATLAAIDEAFQEWKTKAH